MGTASTRAITLFEQWNAGAAAQAAAAAALGCRSLSVLSYPAGVVGARGVVRAAHTTHLDLLKNHYLTLGGSVSGFAKAQVEDIQGVYDSKMREAATKGGAAAYREDALGVVAGDLALQTLLHGALREIFGIHRRPVLPELAVGGAGPGVGAGDAAAAPGEAHEEGKVPAFLRGVLREAWSATWGAGCLQSVGIKTQTMIDILQQVCEDYEDGSFISELFSPSSFSLHPPASYLLPFSLPFAPNSAVFCPKTIKGWREQASTCYASSTPYDPSDSSTYMCLRSKIVLPVGVVELVCTDAQRGAAALTGGVYVVRVVCRPFYLKLLLRLLSDFMHTHLLRPAPFAVV